MTRREAMLRRLVSALGAAPLLFVAACAAAPAAPLAIPAGEDPLRWTAEIEAIAAQPRPASLPVVFVGSSSIRLWGTLQADMAPVPALNCGFGGSRIFDTTYWLERIVLPFEPSVVVVFAGTNDIAGDAPRSAEWVERRFVELVARLRELGCEAPLVYVAITPTPSRAVHQSIVQEANRRIAQRCEQDESLHFVDTASGVLDAQGRPDPRWFRGDRLHLNEAGYAHWARTLRPVVAQVWREAAGRR